LSAIPGALRLIAVYAGAAGATLWVIHRFVRPLARREAAALALLPLLLVGRALVTGGFFGPANLQYSGEPLAARKGIVREQKYPDGILSDVAIAMIPWRKAVRESVKTGHLPLLNRFILCGDPLLASMQPQALHPNTWIGFLLPLATAWTFSCAFTFFLAAVAMWLFLRDRGLEAEPALFGAAVWTLSGFLTFAVGWPHSAVFGILPAVAAGLRRIARSEAGGFPLAVASMTLMVLGGHPESMLHVVAAAGFLFLFDLAGQKRKASRVGLAVAAGALALGLTAVAVLPFREALAATIDAPFRRDIYAHARKSMPVKFALKAATAAFWPAAYGPPYAQKDAPYGFNEILAACVGSLASAFAAVGLFCSRRKGKSGLLMLAILSLGVAACFPGFADLLGQLPLFDITINARLAAVVGFALAAFAAYGYEALAERRRRAEAVLLGAASFVVLGGVVRMELNRRHGIDAPTLGFSLALAAIPAVLVTVARRVPRIGLQAPALVFAIFLVFRLAEIPPLYATNPAEVFYPPTPELANLPISSEPYRVAGWGYSMVPDQASLFEVEDPRGYQAITNRRLRETFMFWCIPQGVWFNRIDDPNRPFLNLLNVRFLLAFPAAPAPAGWKDFVRGANCAIFENPRALPRAFAPKRVRFSSDTARRLEEMNHCDDFRQLAWIEAPGMPDGEIENGPARISVAQDGPDLQLQIRAEKPTWIVVSETNWPGWRATDENHHGLPLVFADHAFVGVRVLAGTHRIHLFYLPRSFVLGAWISVLTALSIVASAIARRRRRLPMV
jgi:hypothetical protein